MSVEITKFLPTPSDRMGALWTLTPVKDIFVIEYGPAGTTHFAIESVFGMGAEINMNVYTTHMSNADITFGNTDKLRGAILEIEEKFSPSYIFIFASSVSALIGADIENFCFEMKDDVRARLIPVTSGGYKGDFNLGIEYMLEIIAKNIVKESEIKKQGSYNIIGSTINCYNFLSDKLEIESILKDVFNLSLNTCFTNFSNISQLETAAQAQYNIVIRAEGISAAEYIKQKFGIDYIYQKPYGYGNTLVWINKISEKWGLTVNKKNLLKIIDGQKENITTFNNILRNTVNRNVLLLGDYDTVIGMHDMMLEVGLNPTILLINHELTKTINELMQNITFKEKIIFKPTEKEKEEIIKNQDFYFVFGNTSIQQMYDKNNFMTISNPNFNIYNFYPYLPLVGFKGSLYLLQMLMNYKA